MTREPFEVTEASRLLIAVALECVADAAIGVEVALECVADAAIGVEVARTARQLAAVMRSEDVKVTLTVRRPVRLSETEVLLP